MNPNYYQNQPSGIPTYLGAGRYAYVGAGQQQGFQVLARKGPGEGSGFYGLGMPFGNLVVMGDGGFYGDDDEDKNKHLRRRRKLLAKRKKLLAKGKTHRAAAIMRRLKRKHARRLAHAIKRAIKGKKLSAEQKALVARYHRRKVRKHHPPHTYQKQAVGPFIPGVAASTATVSPPYIAPMATTPSVTGPLPTSPYMTTAPTSATIVPAEPTDISDEGVVEDEDLDAEAEDYAGEKDGPNWLLIGGIAVAVIGGIAFFKSKKGKQVMHRIGVQLKPSKQAA